MPNKADVILAVALMLLSFLAVMLIQPGGGEAQVLVKQEGEVLYQGPLEKDTQIEVKGQYHNTVIVEDGQVWFAHSDCPGLDCVKMGKIGQKGGTLACAPNRVIVLIQGAEEEVDEIAS